jgi:hypothetical protein
MNRGADARKVNSPKWLTALRFHVKMTLKKCVEPRNIWQGLFVYTSAAGHKAVAGWTEFS